MQIAHFWTKKSKSFFHKERVALVFKKVKRVILSFALVVFFKKQRERFARVDFLERATRAIPSWMIYLKSDEIDMLTVALL